MRWDFSKTLAPKNCPMNVVGNKLRCSVRVTMNLGEIDACTPVCVCNDKKLKVCALVEFGFGVVVTIHNIDANEGIILLLYV